MASNSTSNAGLSIPSTAKALWHDVQTNKMTIKTLPVPTLHPNTTNEHLIRVQSVAPCAGELTWLVLFPPPDPAREPVPCDDVVGTVVTAPQQSPFPRGSEVYARTHFRRPGCAREYTVALTEELALKPRNLGWNDAATVPLSALTAWQALFVHAGLALGRLENNDTGEVKAAPAKSVLVTAASGGVGVWTVQLARLAGYDVIATCGPDNVEFVRSLGAAEVINYREKSLTEWLDTTASGKVDVVIDGVGGKTLQDCWACVKDGGTLISIKQPPEQVKPAEWSGRDVKNLFFIMEPNGQQLSKITALIEQEKCKPALDSVFEFEDFEMAFERLEGGHARGKVVLRVRE